ncbi:hypothetical protein PUN28_001932 [Cardiocondyla obscurior]|uniref:Uncharacterized protein n=1 Tax=Cardiocondyla obscurior TaxID=286306 RepID=A0AAW2GS14_9HYME
MVGRHSHPQTSCRAKTRCNFQDTIVHFHFLWDPSLQAHTKSRSSPVRAENSACLRARSTIAVLESRKKKKKNHIRSKRITPRISFFVHERRGESVTANMSSLLSSPRKNRTRLVVNR